MPAVGEIGYRKEFQRQSQFEEAEDDLYGVHPASGARRALKPAGEEREQSERYGQCEREAQHTDGRPEFIARSGRLDKQSSDNGACARE